MVSNHDPMMMFAFVEMIYPAFVGVLSLHYLTKISRLADFGPSDNDFKLSGYIYPDTVFNKFLIEFLITNSSL